MSSYPLFCCIYFDAWCITCCPKREETLEVYTESYRIYMFGWLCRATYCFVVSASMLGVSHAVQSEKKLWKFTQSDR